MKRIAFLVIFHVFWGGWVFAQTDLQPVAVVRLTRSEPITVKQLKTEVEKMEKQAGRALSADERRQVLDELINQRLALQAAERDRITIADSELNQQIQQMRDTLGQARGRPPTDAEFADAVRQEFDMDMAAFRDQLRRRFLIEKYLMEKKRSVIEAARPPADPEILSAYNNNRQEFVRPATVGFSTIMVPIGRDAGEKNRARELANRLFREIGSDSSKFNEAILRSQSPNSGYQGAHGNYLSRNAQAQQAFGTEAVEVLFSLKEGQVSRVVEIPQGFCIFKVTETYEFTTLGLDDVIQPGDRNRTTVRAFITMRLYQERQQEAIVKATQELITELRTGNPPPFQIYQQNLNW